MTARACLGVEQPAHAPRALSLTTAVLCCVFCCSAGLFFSFHGAIRPVGLSSDGLTLFLSPTYLLVAIAMFLASSTTLLVLHACFAGGVGLACSQSHYGLWLFGVIVIAIHVTAWRGS